jgi:hypothetical protein
VRRLGYAFFILLSIPHCVAGSTVFELKFCFVRRVCRSRWAGGAAAVGMVAACAVLWSLVLGGCRSQRNGCSKVVMISLLQW